MASAIFHSLRGEKSALLLVKANAFVFSSSPVYVPRDAVAGLSQGDTIEIPDGYTLIDMVNEAGITCTTEDGITLKVLRYPEG